jgi:glycosyltransferase involved in cell wall biosynthesis
MTHERFAGLFRRRFWQAADSARWKRALGARADRIVCNSEATRRDLLASIDVPEAKLHVIHAGAPDWSGVAARPMAGTPLPFFLWVGDRHGYKNFLPAMEAWAASAAGRATALLCVGGGPLTPEECRAAARCGALERVHHRAATDEELRWAYEHAAGLLYLSRSEGFGLPVLEARSLGCPIVGSAAAALPEVAGTLAILADPEDRESMAAGIERCLERGRTPEGSAALRARAALFTWDRCAREHERVYEALD